MTLLNGAMAGADIFGAFGICGADQGASPALLVMQHEACRYVERILRGIEINEETIGLDVTRSAIQSGIFLTDSRTILDTIGAENLLGMGDMLFVPPGTAKLTRIHGAFVSEHEIRRIADFCKAQRSPIYLQEISQHVAEQESLAAGADLTEDEKYDEAVAKLGK